MFKCKICGKTFVDLAGLYTHIEKYHKSMIPEDMLVPQYYYYMKTGKTNGNCVMCKQPTTWNKNTSKYNRFCGNPACKEKYVTEFKKRMISKYGKVHLLNDPSKQREMLANRKISGQYRWEDGTITPYTGSYELDVLRLLDDFFDWDPVDISMPSPHTYTYIHDGVERFYIPDLFIHSLDLEVEIKDGGDNPNMHHKIQDVDKVKEKLKDEVLMSQKAFHYIKITNKNYTNFFNFLKKAKEEFAKYDDEKKIPRIFMIEDIKTKTAPKSSKTLYESVEVEEVQDQATLFEQDEIHVSPEYKTKVLEVANELDVKDLITESFISDVEKALKDINKLTVFDFEKYVKLNIDAKRNNPEDVKKYILKLIKASKCEQDMMLIKSVMKKYMDYTEKVAKSDSTKSDVEKEYKLWITTDYKKEYDKKWKKIHESIDYLEFERDDVVEEGYDVLTEAIDIDKALVWLDKPLSKLTNKEITLYHGSIDDIKDKYLTPSGVNVGATKFSNPRWSTYYWDDYKSAISWSLTWAVKEAGVDLLYMGSQNKTLVVIDGTTERELINDLVTKGVHSFIYEVKVPIDKLEIGSAPSIKEYTLSEEALITKKTKVKLTTTLFKEYFEFTTFDEIYKLRNSIKIKDLDSVRTKVLNMVLDGHRDPYRRIIKRDAKAGKVRVGDDLSSYKNVINQAVKDDLYQLKEGAMSFSQLNKILADGDHKRVVKFIDDYEAYHEKMVKEDPSKSESFSNELRRALQYIKDLEKTGKVDNELAKYAIGRLDHCGLAPRPRFESAGNIASLAVVVGATQTRSAFNLTDTNSKLFIDDEHYFSRPDGFDSMNCRLKTDSIDNNISGKRVIRYNIKPNNGSVNMDEVISKYISNTMSVPGLFKLAEVSNSSFIKDICGKLGFGDCDVTMVEDKTY